MSLNQNTVGFAVGPDILMGANCHHRNGGACPACYARVVDALTKVEKASSFAKAVMAAHRCFEAMATEAPRRAR